MTAILIIGYVVAGVLTAFAFVKSQNPRATDDYGQDTGPDIFMPFIFFVIWPVVVLFVICLALWAGFGMLMHKIAGNS